MAKHVGRVGEGFLWSVFVLSDNVWAIFVLDILASRPTSRPCERHPCRQYQISLCRDRPQGFGILALRVPLNPGQRLLCLLLPFPSPDSPILDTTDLTSSGLSTTYPSSTGMSYKLRSVRDSIKGADRKSYLSKKVVRIMLK